MDQEKVNLRQVRDFSETFNASIKILRQNFKLFFQCLLFIAGPFVLISSIAGAFYQASILRAYTPSYMLDPLNFLKQLGFAWVLFILSAIISNLAIMGTVFSFLMNYQESGPGNFTVADVGKTLRKNIGNIILVFLVLFLFAIIAFALLGFIIAGVMMSSTILGILFVFFLMLGMLVIAPPLLWQFSAVYLVKMLEPKGVFESYAQVRRVMKGNYWWTWVIIFCAFLAVMIVGFVFALPQGAYQMVIMFSAMRGGTGETSVVFLVIVTICTFCTTLLQSVIHIVNGVHYYSLAEKKDGQGLMERINEIGNAPNNTVNQQY
jgi:hypothetical protein